MDTEDIERLLGIATASADLQRTALNHAVGSKPVISDDRRIRAAERIAKLAKELNQ